MLGLAPISSGPIAATPVALDPIPHGVLSVGGLAPIGYVITIDNTATFIADPSIATFEVDQ